jgi:hypothetical protein
MSASLGHSGSSAFRLSTATVSMSPAGSCFSNRPFGVKRFQTIHRYGVDVARGLVLLFGIGTRALPSWDSKTGWNNLYDGLTVRVTAGSKRTCDLTSSIVPRGTSFHRFGGARVSSYWIWFCAAFMLPPWLVPGSSGIRRRQPRGGA